MISSNWRSMNEQELTALFRKLGARNPEAWARSQARSGIPQLARYLFLREAWRRVVGPDDLTWVAEMRKLRPTEAGGEIGPALDRLLETGARIGDLTKVIRVMQWWLLAGLCQLLDEPTDLEPEVTSMAWQLFLLDESNNPAQPIGGLIDSVLETDPTGRWMRPSQPGQ